MRKYILPPNGSFFKANLHNHSTMSDGEFSPEQVKKMYMDEGYSIVCYTDHEYLYDHSYLNDENFLALHGYEMAIDDEVPGVYDWRRSLHFNLIAKNPHNVTQVCYHPEFVFCKEKYMNDMFFLKKPHWRLQTVQDINYVIDEANKNGFWVVFNHPRDTLIKYDFYKDFKGLWGIEVFNTGTLTGCNTDEEEVCDQLLRDGQKLRFLSTDDMHSPVHFGGGWTWIKSEKLDYTSVIDAMDKGYFYSSNGPRIFELYEEDGEVHIKTSPARRIILRPEGRNTVVVRDTTGKGITEAVLKIPEICGKYYRITVEDYDRKRAWSNPVFSEEK